MKRMFAGLLILLLLLTTAACTADTAAPAETTAPATAETAQSPDGVVTTMDEFLAALVPGAEIVLGEGEFCLEDASDYGEIKGPYYIWTGSDGQYGLQLQYLEDVTIRGAGAGKTTLICDARWAHVLTLSDCRGVTLEGMTLGHREMTEACEGGVLSVSRSKNVTLQDLGLYGCGTLGVLAYQCEGLTMTECTTYDCSIGGVQLSQCQDVAIQNSTFHSLGKEDPVSEVFSMYNCDDVTVADCDIQDNYLRNFMHCNDNQNLVIRNNRFTNNRIYSAAFTFLSEGVVMDQNVFEENELRNWYSPESFPAIDAAGQEFLPEVPEPVMVDVPDGAVSVSTGKQQIVRVSTPNDFLWAIAPDTCIILDAAKLDLYASAYYQDAAVYLNTDSYQNSYDATYEDPSYPYCYWENNYDGPSLVIHDVNNLTIKAEGTDKAAHTISAVPRYANVLTFDNCSAITLEGFTAGHTPEAGVCMGGVFQFRNSKDILVNRCGMFGCGTMGFDGLSSVNIQIVDSEIYECSICGIQLNNCHNAAISNTLIRDIGDEYWGETYFIFHGSNGISLDGVAMDGNYSGK